MKWTFLHLELFGLIGYAILKNILSYTLIFVIILSSCEDEPLLSPQISECAPGDSCCEISLPSDKEDSKNNPKLFNSFNSSALSLIIIIFLSAAFLNGSQITGKVNQKGITFARANVLFKC